MVFTDETYSQYVRWWQGNTFIYSSHTSYKTSLSTLPQFFIGKSTQSVLKWYIWDCIAQELTGEIGFQTKVTIMMLPVSAIVTMKEWRSCDTRIEMLAVYLRVVTWLSIFEYLQFRMCPWRRYVCLMDGSYVCHITHKYCNNYPVFIIW